MRIRIQVFTSMRIRIRLSFLKRIRIRTLLLIKVMRICDHWITDPPSLHFESPHLHCERPRPSTVPFCAFKATEYFHSNADPYPASQTNADPGLQPCRLKLCSVDSGLWIFYLDCFPIPFRWSDPIPVLQIFENSRLLLYCISIALEIRIPDVENRIRDLIGRILLHWFTKNEIFLNQKLTKDNALLIELHIVLKPEFFLRLN